ncbi:MAG: hypothetical protein GY730_01955 [bacterium]|nr:hypothetical protein [bacterium]
MILTLILPLEPVSGYRGLGLIMHGILTRGLEEINRELGLHEKNSKDISHYHKLPAHILPGEDRVGLYFESSVTSINVNFLIDMAFVLMRIARCRLNDFYEVRMNKYYDCENILKRSFPSICVSSELIRYLFPPENTFLFVNSSQVFSNSMGASVTGKEIVTMINDKYNYAYEKTIRNYMCGSTIKEYTVNCIRLNCTSITPFSITNNFSLVFSKKDEDQVQTCLSEEDTKKIFRDTILESVYYIVSQVRNITTFYISPSTLNKILTNIKTGREPFSK